MSIANLNNPSDKSKYKFTLDVSFNDSLRKVGLNSDTQQIPTYKIASLLGVTLEAIRSQIKRNRINPTAYGIRLFYNHRTRHYYGLREDVLNAWKDSTLFGKRKVTGTFRGQRF
ncbi:MAG: hypothetical protein JXI43_11695 [Tissierellales bacterium]|nr:hypothetical protein [Tissierellales bacterium]